VFIFVTNSKKRYKTTTFVLLAKPPLIVFKLNKPLKDNIMQTAYKRPAEICRFFSISRATLYRYAKDKNFPKPLKPSKKVTLWDIREVEEYFKNIS